MNPIKFLKVLAVGSGVGLSLMAGGYYFYIQPASTNTKAALFTEALFLARHYRPIVDQVGKPVKEGGWWNKRNEAFAGRYVSKLEVPVKGPKGSGTLYIYGSRPESDQQYEISHLEFNNDTTKKTWKFYEKNDDGSPSYKELYKRSVDAVRKKQVGQVAAAGLTEPVKVSPGAGELAENAAKKDSWWSWSTKWLDSLIPAPLVFSAAVQSPDTSSVQSPDTSSVQSPGTSSVQSPDTSSVQSPDTSSVQSLDTSSATQNNSWWSWSASSAPPSVATPPPVATSPVATPPQVEAKGSWWWPWGDASSPNVTP